ncbi:importin-13 isoform X2 [Fundulus heteroclitus]|uniref:importin-13 isoform X2 n=1 Tax=Fundulus heteroclitus TaxID=8078 RepID=UPI00165AEE1E|nr:importin-13 isoform X2 [Fundulus heteroclitus]
MESAATAGQSPVELEFTQENVETALYQLYFDPDMERKNVAQKWLTQAQASAQAWQFCWALLNPEKIPEIQFFGASTLHIKICRHWGDLPAEHHEDLRTQLLSHILRFSSGPKMVLTRLCVALASMALNLIPQAWSKPVADMVRAFQPQKADSEGDPGAKASQDPHAHCLALLELLTVLPEEFQSGRLAQARRTQLREALVGEWAVVCAMLRQLLQSQDSSVKVKEKVLRCFSSWVGLDVPLGESQELVQDCFTALSDPGLFDTAVETIVTAVSQPDCQRFISVLLSLMPLVLGLYDQLKTAAQDGDMETTHGICRIAVALGETHSRVLLEQLDHWQEYMALVNMILFCTGIPGHYPVNETTSSLTLTFWYTLQDDILSFEEEKQGGYLQVYKPVYFQLVDVLLLKSHYPSQEEYASWSSDDKEQFRIYRVDISDTLMYVYEMLGAELLSNLYDRLARLLMDPQQSAVWQDTEALLFGFQSIAETIDVNYSDVIPGLIGLIPRINIGNVMLADTVMYTIGSLAEWLADHPVMLAGILPMVLRGLVKAELSVSSISTLKRICRECRHDLAPYAQDILTVSQDVLLKEIHESSQCMWLMQALGFLLSALPPEEILGRLHSLITPHIQQLDSLARQEMVHIFAGEEQHIPDIRSLVEVLTLTTLAIFQQGPREHPDVAESFMCLHAQILKRSPDLHPSAQSDVKALFYSGILSIKFPETPTAKAACLFFTEFLSRCKDMPSLSDVLQSDGKTLTETVLQAVGGGSSRSLMEHFSEVLLSLNRQCPALLSQWLTETLQTPGFPSAHVTAEQKHAFSQQILREQTNKRRVKETVKEFSLLCRGLQGSGYSEC